MKNRYSANEANYSVLCILWPMDHGFPATARGLRGASRSGLVQPGTIGVERALSEYLIFCCN